ncbi:MAG: putative transport system permease protein [Solirubrobacteraceae bacterium]|jgi:putative ABC transport system permease protein|nr:putative transport system permease protein [Solirubrobacteraceae bacterium]
MTALTWLRGLLAHRRSRVVATALGVAVGVALLASIGSFLSSTTSKMTQRAIARVPVDWQVEAQPGADPAAVLKQVRQDSAVRKALPVGFAKTTGLRASAGGTVQTTGPGEILGLPDGYAQSFPGELRTLAGSGTGVLLAQQTAANLHAQPGDTITIGRAGLPPAKVRVDGVVDLPAADSLFQKVGAPVGAQAQAPPDNVILLPQSVYTQVVGPLAAKRPDLVKTQVHAALSHQLPGSPNAAFTQVSGHARNLETRLAGAGLVGDALGSALDQARGDALYAQVLFLVLGIPGAVLAALITASIAAAGASRRRRDGALLRTRGATTRQLVRLAVAEAALAGAAGVAVGLGAALVVGRIAFGAASFGASTSAALAWAVGSAVVGLLIAAGAIALPAWRDARSLTVAGQRRQVGRTDRAPAWERYGLDVLCLVGAGLIFWQASRNGYQLVLAPEGVPQVSVNWYALLAPILAWIGAGLLAFRLADLVLVRGRTPLARLVRPVAGELSPTVAATMGRQRMLLARAVALVALTAGFAGSTGVFNSTYQQQAEVDARLSNGADVTVTESPGAHVGPAEGARLAKVPGVRSVEPLQHRFAYIGADLQDLYGVRPQSITSAGKLQDPWFAGGTASGLMAKLAQRPDSILVSAETVKDFQLQPGDTVRLRLVDGRTGKPALVSFHYAGVAKEFPTAPKDSFFVADQGYVAQQTHSDAVGTFLVQTDGTSPSTVAQRVRGAVGTGATVTDLVDQRKVVGSNLTAVELSGLTRVELGFALVLAIAATGLALALGFKERRRTFAIAAALGAKPRQLGGFIWAESAFVTGGGLVLGTAIAAGLSALLVKVLTGVFDPPPAALSVPWAYLLAVAALAVGAAGAAGAVTLRLLRRPAIEELRDL